MIGMNEVEHIIFDYVYAVGDMMGVELRAGTDANGVEYKTDVEMRKKMFDYFSAHVDVPLYQAVKAIKTMACNDGRSGLQKELRELLGLTSDDD